MAAIWSGSGSGTLLTVDPTSKAMRSTLYDTASLELAAGDISGSYIASINVRNTTTLTGLDCIWWLTNLPTSTKSAYIRRVWLTAAFDAATVAAGIAPVRFSRILSGTPPTGGATVAIGKKRSTYPTSAVGDVRQGAGTLVRPPGFRTVFQEDLLNMQLIEKTGFAKTFDRRFNRYGDPDGVVEIPPNNAIGMWVTSAQSIAGCGYYGFVEWDER